MSAVNRIREQYQIEGELRASEALVAILRDENRKLRELVEVLARPRITEADCLAMIHQVKAIEGKAN